MSKIVELTGPPGVGKSTYYKTLINQWNNKLKWAPRHKFYSQKSTSPIGSSEHLIHLARKLFNKPVFANNKGYEFLEQNSLFVDYCWRMINNNLANDINGVDSRFRSAYHLFSVFRDYQGIIDCKDPRICITDEFLNHRIIQITEVDERKSEIEEYVSLMPSTSGVIFLDAPVEVLVKRIQERPKKILRHKKLVYETLNKVCENDRKRFQYLYESLKNRGCDLIKIDTTQPIKKSIEIIKKYLSKIDLR